MSSIDEMMAAMGLPVGFGKKTKSEKKEQFEKQQAAAVQAEPVAVDEKESDDESDDDFGPKPSVDVDQEELDELPITNSVVLKAHTKSVTALTVDPSGGRLITGGRDNQMYIWDFHTMDKRLHHYKKFEPVEGNPVSFLLLKSRLWIWLLVQQEIAFY
jgi:WD40 repeat protein